MSWPCPRSTYVMRCKPRMAVGRFWVMDHRHSENNLGKKYHCLYRSTSSSRQWCLLVGLPAVSWAGGRSLNVQALLGRGGRAYARRTRSPLWDKAFCSRASIISVVLGTYPSFGTFRSSSRARKTIERPSLFGG